MNQNRLPTIFMLILACLSFACSNSQAKKNSSSYAFLPASGLENAEISVLPIEIASTINSFDQHTLTGQLIREFNLSSSMIFRHAPKLNQKDSINGLTTSKTQLFNQSRTLAMHHAIPFVLFGVVEKASRRVGGTLGSEKPATLSYRIWLYSKANDEIVWTSAYKSDEKSISDNLLDVPSIFSSGVGFSSFEKLLKQALQETASQLDNYARGSVASAKE